MATVNETKKPGWLISVEQNRAQAKKLIERGEVLQRGTKAEALEAMRLYTEARKLAFQATQIEAYFLHGEIVTTR
jgi:hypothetical protein